jgi:hypothetical protein
MKNNKTLLASAAVAGIVAGCVTAKAKPVPTNGAAFKYYPVAGVMEEVERGETHSCKGTNSCRGKGGCTTGDNGCQGLNSCKEKGGCAMKDGEPVNPMPTPTP